jgi:hypothetical protein
VARRRPVQRRRPRCIESLPAGLEARSDERAGRAENERGGQAAAVRDAAGGEHRSRPGEVDDGGDERQRGPPAPVPAGLAALGHDDVRPGIQSPPRFVEIGDLDDQAGARAADVLGEG